MDIFNINIHHITRQYLEYIKTMRRLDLEVAGEFVAMAATLLHIKSRMLLPQYNEEGEEIKEDPRKELVQKLLEYKKIKELSGELYKLPLLGRDVFARGERTDVEAEGEGELVLEENPLFSLIASYRTALKNMKKTVHRVIGELQSISARIMEIRHLLVVGKRLLFRDLISEQEAGRPNQVLITFLSLLELAKVGIISVFQSEPFADIHLETKKAVDGDVISQVENYDSVNAEAKADAIIGTAQLSLTEAEPMLEGEEAPVVQETFADAATDADIEAEEARLFATEEAPATQTGDAVETEEPVGETPTKQSSEGDLTMQTATEGTPVESRIDEAEAFAAEVEAAFATSGETPTLETVTLDQPFEAASPAPAPEEPTSEPASPVDRNVNSAVNAALDAFAAFQDEDDKEVES